MRMSMENANKNLIRFIDAILHEMEILPNPDEIKLSWPNARLTSLISKPPWPTPSVLSGT